MGKFNLKAGFKLDLTARLGDDEVSLKSSFFKESAGKLQLSMPLLGGKSVPLESGTAVALDWGADGVDFHLDGSVAGTVKQGVRTYLVVSPTGEVEHHERRAFVRVPAEIDVEIISYNTNANGERVKRVYPGRTTDISNGGVAVCTDAPMAVGETMDLVMARKGTKKVPLRAAICWTRPAPRGSGYREMAGFQFFFLNSGEAAAIAKMVASLASKTQST